MKLSLLPAAEEKPTKAVAVLDVKSLFVRCDGHPETDAF
jgi:hypothetical protein